MTLPDYPQAVLSWNVGLDPELLQALGKLAVVTAQIEEVLHQIYWKHAGLDEVTGPIVTDNLNPKRLAEDIIKLVGLDPTKANVLADLKILLAEFEHINTKRNQCLHWIWDLQDADETITLVGQAKIKASPYSLKPPAYKQKGQPTVQIEPEGIQNLWNACIWLMTRLSSHALDEDELRQRRAQADRTGRFAFNESMTLADLFCPAPWLDKPLPLGPKPSTPAD
jgi:hypothetical protein